MRNARYKGGAMSKLSGSARRVLPGAIIALYFNLMLENNGFQALTCQGGRRL